MITPEQWDLIGNQASKIYSQLELEIIQEIAERIANVGYANTVVLNDILIAEEMGLMYQDIIQLVAKYNETSASKIKDIFETAGVKSLEYDDKIYKLAGLEPTALKQSTSMWQLLSATARKTHNNLNNLVMTTANTSQTQFYNAMNKAYMEVSTGVKSYSQAILDTIKDVSQQGVYIEYPSGQHRSIESAVRMNIVTSVNQTCGKLQEMRADEMGWDLMELTAHSGARPEHAEWQGKIVSRSGRNKKYLSLDDIGYGEATGFKGVNCRHDWMPFYEGSSRTYTNKELLELKNEKVTYNGKQISQYDAEQMQRKMERQIRKGKKDIAGLQGILTSGNKDDKLLEDTRIQLANAQIKLKQDNSILNNFTKQTGLKKDSTRLVVGNKKQIDISSNQLNKINTITANNLFEKLDINPKDYVAFGKYDPFDNDIQERTAELLGIDKLPKIISKKEYQKNEGTEIVRVVHSYHGKTAREAYENTIRGKIQYSENTNSSFGRGIYFGDKSVESTILSFYSGKNGDSKIINAKIDKSAKILEFNNQIEYLKDVNSRILKLPDNLKKIYEKETSLLYMLDGIDGIKIKTNQYYCIYNRGVLIINE